MITGTKLRIKRLAIIAAALVLLGCQMVTSAHAQDGDNAICTSAGCGSVTNSAAFVDASVFPTSTNDVCAQINAAYPHLPTAGGVIDARGAAPGTGNTFSCAHTPW
jgi:hypothetical protein